MAALDTFYHILISNRHIWPKPKLKKHMSWLTYWQTGLTPPAGSAKQVLQICIINVLKYYAKCMVRFKNPTLRILFKRKSLQSTAYVFAYFEG